MAHYLDYPGLDYYTRRVKEQFAEKLEQYTSGAISKVFIYMGSVDNYEDLPTEGLVVGHVYNVVNAYPDKDIKAGDNVCWNGEDWDDLAGKVDTDSLITIEQATANKQEVQDAIDDVTKQLENYILVDKAGEIIGEYLTWEDFLASFEVVTDEEVRALFPSEDDANLLVTGDLNIDDAFDVDGNVWVNGNITGEGTLTSTGWINATGSISATIKQNATLSSPHISISNGQTQFGGNSSVSNGTCSVGGTGVTNNATCVVNCDMEIESSSYGIYNRNNSFTIAKESTIAIISDSTGLYNALGQIIIDGALSLATTYDEDDNISANRGIENYKDFTVTTNGTINIIAGTRGIYNGGTASIFTVEGQITIDTSGSNNRAIDTYSGGTFTVLDGGTVNITQSYRGIQSTGEVTVATNATINITSRNYGIYLSGTTAILTVDGAIAITNGSGVYVAAASTLTGNGTITVNGDPYTW